MIIGIDEVGRGAWAGPLVVGAVSLSDSSKYSDSKSLGPDVRQRLAREIRMKGAKISLGWVSSVELDSLGLTQATKVAIDRSLAHFDITSSSILIDGNLDFLGTENSSAIIKGDEKVPQIAAASIVAKVSRDNLMKKLDNIFPEFGFSSNVGYGTAKHLKALEEFGVTRVHRQSFKPIYETQKKYHQNRKSS